MVDIENQGSNKVEYKTFSQVKNKVENIMDTHIKKEFTSL